MPPRAIGVPADFGSRPAGLTIFSEDGSHVFVPLPLDAKPTLTLQLGGEKRFSWQSESWPEMWAVDECLDGSAWLCCGSRWLAVVNRSDRRLVSWVKVPAEIGMALLAPDQRHAVVALEIMHKSRQREVYGPAWIRLRLPDLKPVGKLQCPSPLALSGPLPAPLASAPSGDGASGESGG